MAEPGGQGRDGTAQASPIFGRSVNPIPNSNWGEGGGADYALHVTTAHPHLNSFDLPQSLKAILLISDSRGTCH